MKNKAILFDKALEFHHITKKEFSIESKIPYDTVAGWKKRGQVPEYAVVLLKKIAAEKRRRYSAGTAKMRSVAAAVKMTAKIAQRVQAAFWGKDYGYKQILLEVKKGNPLFVRPLFENLYYKDVLVVLGQKEIQKILPIIKVHLNSDVYGFWQRVVSR